ncbi:hypothetical protein HDA40_002172 [Hamadaea flava]|uniref:Uncharacterized protein n=1 Tax=Hamadaea flava TaxID=1742688 RepID=A0ABV8LL50_9ACTN|nr:hypothetical protein [Hamadaea flava]MCP2323665.1 hypothetical protein [Hamadaea flava]
MTTPLPLGGDFDVTAGDPPVPLATWRTPRDPAAGPHQVPAALAARLCAAYSRPGEPIVDAIGEPAVAAAAAAYGRHHIPATIYDLAHLLAVAQPITALVLLRWPPANPTPATATVDRVTSGAALLLRPGGCLAVLADPQAGPANLATIIGAATATGVRYLQHVIAIDADIIGDHLQTDTAEVVAPARHARAHRDVLVFVRDGDSRGMR